MTVLAMKHSRMAASMAMGRAQAVFPIWATFSKRYSDRAASAAVDGNRTGVAPICAMTWKSAWKKHRSEEHTSELQSLMRISDAGFCLQTKINKNPNIKVNLQ